MKCLTCGTQNPEGVTHCGKCRKSLTAHYFTPPGGIARHQAAVPSNTKDLILGRPGTTDVSVFSTGIIALLLTAIFYLVFPLPLLKGTYFYAIFVERGFVQHIITLLFFWSAAILVFKLLKLLDQKSAFNLTLIPAGMTNIKPNDAEQLIANLYNLEKEPRHKVLLNRVLMALESYQSSGQVEKVDTVLGYQSQVDSDILESSYTIFRVFVWAIPIWGFIGTVLGLSLAVNGLSNFTKVAIEIDQVKAALGVITSGLGVAFDTTLLGLLCAVGLMIPSTALVKMEENFLVAVEKFCFDNLISRFQSVAAPAEIAAGPAFSDEKVAYQFKQIIQETFDNYLKQLQDCFQTWNGGFGQVMEGVTGQTKLVGEQFGAIKPIAEGFKVSVAEFTTQLKGVAGQQAEVVNKLSMQLNSIQPILTNMTDIRNTLDHERKSFLEQATNWQQNMERTGVNIVNKIADQQQQQVASFNDVRIALEQERRQFVEQATSWLQSLEKTSANIVGRMVEQQQQQLAGINEVKNTLDNERRGFQDQANNWMRNLDRVGNDIITKVSERQQLQSAGQSKELQEVMQSFNSLVNKENEIVGLISKNYEQMAVSDRMFKQTLEGIRVGLENLKPSLEQIAKPRKVKFIEE